MVYSSCSTKMARPQLSNQRSSQCPGLTILRTLSTWRLHWRNVTISWQLSRLVQLYSRTPLETIRSCHSRQVWDLADYLWKNLLFKTWSVNFPQNSSIVSKQSSLSQSCSLAWPRKLASQASMGKLALVQVMLSHSKMAELESTTLSTCLTLKEYATWATAWTLNKRKTN